MPKQPHISAAILNFGALSEYRPQFEQTHRSTLAERQENLGGQLPWCRISDVNSPPADMQPELFRLWIKGEEQISVEQQEK